MPVVPRNPVRSSRLGKTYYTVEFASSGEAIEQLPDSGEEFLRIKRLLDESSIESKIAEAAKFLVTVPTHKQHCKPVAVQRNGVRKRGSLSVRKNHVGKQQIERAFVFVAGV